MEDPVTKFLEPGFIKSVLWIIAIIIVAFILKSVVSDASDLVKLFYKKDDTELLKMQLQAQEYKYKIDLLSKEVKDLEENIENREKERTKIKETASNNKKTYKTLSRDEKIDTWNSTYNTIFNDR